MTETPRLIYIIHTNEDHERVLEHGINDIQFPQLTQIVDECTREAGNPAVCYLVPEHKVDTLGTGRVSPQRFKYCHRREMSDDFSYVYHSERREPMGLRGRVIWGGEGDTYDVFHKILEGNHPSLKQMHADSKVGVIVNFAEHYRLVTLLNVFGYAVKQRTHFIGDGWNVPEGN
ncbi:hypothetical protein HYU06_03750 [Candidatus Woesearchaeota archaeon]|nr:hypothetical protein [Candidatus Woesearchaeota archaeon]